MAFSAPGGRMSSAARCVELPSSAADSSGPFLTADLDWRGPATPSDPARKRALMSALVDTVPLIGHVVGGQVTTPDGARTQDVLNPATGEVSGRLLLAEQADVDAVVAGAGAAAESWGQEPIGKR